MNYIIVPDIMKLHGLSSFLQHDTVNDTAVSHIYIYIWQVQDPDQSIN